MSFLELPDKDQKYPEKITLCLPRELKYKLDFLKRKKGKEAVAEELRKLIAGALEGVEINEAS